MARRRSTEQTDQADQAEQTDQADQAEQTEQSEQTEQTDQADQAEQTEQTEQTDQADQAEQTEQSEQTDQADQTEQTDQADQAEQTEQTVTVHTDQDGLITGETVNPAPATDQGVSLDFISSGGFTLSPELAKTSEPKRERNPRQRAMDERVTALHKHWNDVGQPSTWGKLVETKCVTTYFIDPEKTADFKKLVNRAGSFHNLRIRYGNSFQATEELVRKHGLPAEYVGREVVSFAVMSRRPRAANGSGKSGAELADQVNESSDTE